jgi:site-specific DNA recombinase
VDRRRPPTRLHNRPDCGQTSAAVDRYLIAFERGTLDDDAPEIRNRLTTLKSQAKALRARKAELELDLDQPPQALTPGDISAIRDHIRHVLDHESHTNRKALFEALIHEVTITADDTVRPSSTATRRKRRRASP